MSVAFGLAVLALTGAYFYLTRYWTITPEDYRFITRGTTARGYISPYNKQLSIVPIALYQMMARLFGAGTYVPYRLVAISAFVAVSVAMFALVRHRISALPAAAAGIILVTYSGTALVIPTFNF